MAALTIPVNAAVQEIEKPIARTRGKHCRQQKITDGLMVALPHYAATIPNVLVAASI
jgi:hypothetical protein